MCENDSSSQSEPEPTARQGLTRCLRPLAAVLISVVAAVSLVSLTAVPALVAVIKHGNIDQKRWAAEQLSALGPRGLPRFLALLRSGPQDTRQVAAVGLSSVEFPADVWIRLMKDSSPHVRLFAVCSLYELRHRAAPAIPVVSAALKEDGNARGRRYSAMTWSAIAPEPEQVRAPLTLALNDEDEFVRLRAAVALQSNALTSDAARQVLRDSVRSDNAGVRELAALLIRQLGYDSPLARSLLEEAMKDEEDFVRAAARESLVRTGGTP